MTGKQGCCKHWTCKEPALVTLQVAGLVLTLQLGQRIACLYPSLSQMHDVLIQDCLPLGDTSSGALAQPVAP